MRQQPARRTSDAVDAGDDRQPVVFLAGLTHSGSTVLDFVLGSARRFVGLGEVIPLLHSGKVLEPERTCSCGALLPACPFWSRLLQRRAEWKESVLADRYRAVLRTFAEVFGPDRIPVDSSKSLRAMKIVASMPDVEARVVHLVRDVRGWTVSQRNLQARREASSDANGRDGPARWFSRVARRSPLVNFLIWQRQNRQIRGLLEERRIPTFTVGYEQLALDSDRVLERLERFLGAELSARIGASESHLALGNRLRLDEKKRSKIVYDYRWMQRRDWEVAALLLPSVMRDNRDWVYGGTAGSGVPAGGEANHEIGAGDHEER